MTTGDTLKTHWQSQGMPVLSGVSSELITRFESEHRVILPSDMRDYFEAVNGMAMHFPHDQDKNGFTFFPLEQLRTVTEEARIMKNKWILSSAADSLFVFCDYLTWCWVYAIHLSRDPSKANRVVIIGGQRKEPVIAASFSEFVELYVGDSPELYQANSIVDRATDPIGFKVDGI